METKSKAHSLMLEAKGTRLLNRMKQIYDSRNNLDTRAKLRAFQRQALEIENLYSRFETVFEESMRLQVEANPEFVPDYKLLDHFEEMFYEVKELLGMIERDKSPEGAGTSTDARVRFRDQLPKIELMTFDGDPMQWPLFSETFKQLVHDNPLLDSVTKMHYLLSKLKGKALATCAGILPTASNYMIAWEALVSQFEDKRTLAGAYVRQIFEFKSMSSNSGDQLNSFMVQVEPAVRSLRQLKLRNADDFFLTSFLLSKLDPETRLAFERSLGRNEIPCFDQLATFIREQYRTLAHSTDHIGKGGSKSGRTGSLKTFTVRERSSKAEGWKSGCELCRQSTHRIHKCPEFVSLAPRERKRLAFKYSLCFNCLGSGHSGTDCKSTVSCSRCQQRHHSLLHIETPAEPSIRKPASGETSGTVVHNAGEPGTKQTVLVSRSTLGEGTAEVKQTVLLSTAVVWVKPRSGGRVPMRILLDSASQCSFITDKFCRRLNLQVKPVVTSVSGIGSEVKRIKGQVSFTFRSRFQPGEYKVKAWVIDKITENLPSLLVEPKIHELLVGKQLADESFAIPGVIDGMIGAELVPVLLGPGRSLGEGWPMVVESPLGLIVMGKAPIQSAYAEHQVFCCTDLSELLQKFWELDSVEESPRQDPEDSACEEFFVNSVCRGDDGRYTVALPFRKFPPELGGSYEMALRRFLTLERKFSRCPELGAKYRGVMEDYINQGHMQRVDPAKGRSGYFIPHHGILKQSSTSTPLRVVFDASAPSTNGLSLNDTMFVGPKLQNEIFNLLVKFRAFKVAMTADVRQMYRQIWVCEEHRPFQRLLWRFSTDEPVGTYELTTVTFGVKASPFLALRTVKQLAADERGSFPVAAKRVEDELYMDDVISSVPDVSEALELYQQWLGLFRAGGFQLTKWATNSAELLERIPAEDRRSGRVEFPTDILMVLGLRWSPDQDVLNFQVKVEETGWTKRSVLSTMARIWDPLGLLVPVTVSVKIFMKGLWNSKLDWDDSLPPRMLENWKEFVGELSSLRNFSIPRHLGITRQERTWLVGFADASEKAYAAVVYVLVGGSEFPWKSRLLCSKAKVAPMKVVSIPRLELCAALLLARLLKSILSTYKDTVDIQKVVPLTDSTVVLHWLAGAPNRWKVFVANRVSKIQEILPETQWGHVRSEDNPADCASRGLSPKQFLETHLWLEGPTWLKQSPEQWPISSSTRVDVEVDLEERVERCLVTVDLEPPLGGIIERCSSWTKMLRITIYVLRFIRRLPRGGGMKASDFDRAETVLCKVMQRFHFSDLFQSLESGKLLEKKWRILTPFISEGMLRVGGRLGNAPLKFDQKHPLLLPKESNFTLRLIDYMHLKYLHAGPALVSSLLRQRYWILGGRDLIRQRLHRCITCFRCKPTLTHPMMADLSPARVAEIKPFAHTGVDFAGPFKITLSHHRGVKATKGYFCIFNCLTTRAVHLEAASDLSTECCLAAIKRFLSRRGPCAVFYSDQGTNFVGAKRQLSELEEFLASDALQQGLQKEFAEQRIEWRFNPPSAPHFGGSWEAGVKSVKHHLSRVIGEQVLTFEEFATLLCEIEAVLNARPLGWLSTDPADPVALTPAHFLTLTPLRSLPAVTGEGGPKLSQRRVLIEKIVQGCWSRWRLEYLSTLQKRMKWNTPACPVRAGMVVLIHQDNVPSLRWPLGRIEEVYPGKDGVVRVALVKTQTGTYKRPVVKLAPLPLLG